MRGTACHEQHTRDRHRGVRRRARDRRHRRGRPRAPRVRRRPTCPARSSSRWASSPSRLARARPVRPRLRHLRLRQPLAGDDRLAGRRGLRRLRRSPAAPPPGPAPAAPSREGSDERRQPPPIVPIETPTLGDRSYLVHDGEVAFVVDPQRDIDRVLRPARRARRPADPRLRDPHPQRLRHRRPRAGAAHRRGVPRQRRRRGLLRPHPDPRRRDRRGRAHGCG